jgi:hypothetical protein
VSSIEVSNACSAGAVADGEGSALEDSSTFFAAAANIGAISSWEEDSWYEIY